MTQFKEKPLVSVIVPNYNYAHYLPERIDSILKQTFTDFEIILLDDASSDDSANILNRYRDNEHVSHIVINEKNTGSPFPQWMKGITLARGKYIWIAEADDLSKPDFLEVCIQAAKKHTDTAICYTGSLLIDASGKHIYRDIDHWGKRAKKKLSSFNGKQYIRHNLYWKNYIVNASGAIFLKEYADKLIKSDFLKMRYAGDWFFWVEMAMQGNVVEVYQKLNYYRQHGNKVTKTAQRTGGGIAENIRIIQYMEEKLTDLDEYKKRLRHGLVYKQIKRLSVNDSTKERLYDLLHKTLGGDIHDYRLAQRNKYFRLIMPALISSERDRLY